MGHVFTLTDGTTTISLVASGVLLDNYAMSVPEGDDVTVVDTVDIMVEGASGAAMQSKARAIEAMMDAATRYHRTRTGARVFVTAQLISDADAWRSEIVGGRLEPADDTLAVWANNKARMTLYIERMPYWEGPETPLPLSNGNGTNNTAGLTLYNDGSGVGTSPTVRNNWAQIAAGVVTGALPAAVNVELKNTTGSAQTLNAVHMANLALNDPTNFPHILQAEARTAGGTVAANASASGGSVVQLTNYVSGQTVTWDLSATLLQKTQGRWFRLMLSLFYRTATVDKAETVQAEILDGTGAFVLVSGPEVAIAHASIAFDPLFDLGALPLPPGGYDAAWGALKLRLTFRIASGTATTYLDYLQITPTDSYRVLDMRPAAIANNALVVDNGYDDLAYVETAGARAPYVMPRGEPLLVWPGKLQRIYVLADRVSGPLDIDHKWAVRAWYRPRRLSI